MAPDAGAPRTATAAAPQRTGAGNPGSVDNPDLVVEVLGRTLVALTDVGTAEVGALGAGTFCAGTVSAAVVERVDGGGALLCDEHEVATATTATAASRRRLNEQLEKESPRAASRPGLGPGGSAPGG